MPEPKTERQYRNDIIRRMKGVGTYREEFAQTIDRLASLYVQRDQMEEKFKRAAEMPVILHTNKGGATNPAKNPYLAARDELYAQMLSHERELGLTPSALRKMNAAAFAAKEELSGVRGMLMRFDEQGD